MDTLGIILLGGFLVALAVWLVWAIYAMWRDNISDDGSIRVRPKRKGTGLVVGREYLAKVDGMDEWQSSIYMGSDLDGYRWFHMAHLGKQVGFKCSIPEALFEAPKIKYVWAQMPIPDRVNRLTGKKI